MATPEPQPSHVGRKRVREEVLPGSHKKAHVEHVELHLGDHADLVTWLRANGYKGEFTRMTQFKDPREGMTLHIVTDAGDIWVTGGGVQQGHHIRPLPAPRHVPLLNIRHPFNDYRCQDHEVPELATFQRLKDSHVEPESFIFEAIPLMNKRFAFIHDTDAIVVEKVWRVDPDEARGRWDYVHRKVGAFHRLYSHWTFTFTVKHPTTEEQLAYEETRVVKLLDAWASSLMKLTYQRVVFNPKPYGLAGCAQRDEFNLYRGMAITREDAARYDVRDAIPWLEHVRTIVAGKERADIAEYVLNWNAHILQFPWIKPDTAITMTSPPGGGKNLTYRPLAQILGRHFKVVQDPEDLIGRFNGSTLKDAILCFADEVNWHSGRSAGRLKTTITQQKVRCEEKHMPVYCVSSYARLVFASNEEHVAPCGAGARRFLPLELVPKYCGRQTAENKAYFDRLAAVPAGAVAKFLYERDLSTFNPRALPYTKALQKQMELTLQCVQSWWVACLTEGVLLPGDTEAWGEPVEKHRVYAKYAAYTGTGAVKSITFWRRLKKLLADAPGLTMSRSRTAGTRPYLVQLPPLADCQQAFRQYMGNATWTF